MIYKLAEIVDLLGVGAVFSGAADKLNGVAQTICCEDDVAGLETVAALGLCVFICLS